MLLASAKMHGTHIRATAVVDGLTAVQGLLYPHAAAIDFDKREIASALTKTAADVPIRACAL